MKMKVKFYLSVSDNKCSLVEIVQKTLQRKFYSYMIENESMHYLGILQHTCLSYNNSFHTSIKTTPEKAKQPENFTKIQTENLEKLHKLKKLKVRVRFAVGDIVRVSLDKKKNVFSRSYNLQNSYPKFEIYKISVKNSAHAKYFLKHVASSEVIKNGYFYDWQLTRCTNPEFRGSVIKTRVRRGKKEFLFEYKGYPDRFNEWKKESEVSDLF